VKDCADARPTSVVALPGRNADSAAGLRTEVIATGARYIKAVERAGGQPIVVPRLPTPTPTTPPRCSPGRDSYVTVDALVMVGGADIDPALYGALRHPRPMESMPARRVRVGRCSRAPSPMACRFWRSVEACRRSMSLAEARSSSICRMTRRSARTARCIHDVHLSQGSLVADAAGATRVCGHSVHHQAVDRVGEGLRVTGRASDGTIEAIELEQGWVVGIQWHPEDTAERDAHQSALFDALVAQAQRRLSQRGKTR
jgi:putative glutamine amidotransferase